MSEIPLLPSHEIVRILGIFGFRPVLQSGTHTHLLNPGHRLLVTVPSHPEIAEGILVPLLRKAEIGREAFLKHVA
jgi:predicted RNA binding protein YcfA (HicA-like mRNA interferase family)